MLALQANDALESVSFPELTSVAKDFNVYVSFVAWLAAFNVLYYHNDLLLFGC